MVLMVLTGWLERRERSALAYLIEENRLLRRQLGGRRLRFTDDDRGRLAGLAHRVGRAALRKHRHDHHARHGPIFANIVLCNGHHSVSKSKGLGSESPDRHGRSCWPLPCSC
jgi:hypothetical protein